MYNNKNTWYDGEAAEIEEMLSWIPPIKITRNIHDFEDLKFIIPINIDQLLFTQNNLKANGVRIKTDTTYTY